MTDIKKLLARIGAARDVISKKEEQTGLDFMIDGVLMNCAVTLKEQQEEIENLMQTAQSMMEGICLLKEQEAVKPVLDELTGRIWLCENCRSYVGFEDNDPYDPNEYDKYCRECGRPVLWEGR